MIKTIFACFAALVAAAALAFVLVGRERSWELIAGSPDHGTYNFDSAQRSPTHNDSLACSRGLCQKPDFEIAPVGDAPSIAIEKLVQRLLATDPLARRVDDGSNPNQARFVTYSPIMRFPDMIYLEARPLPDGQTGLMAYAKAQLGKMDFGANRERLKSLLAGK